MENWIHWWIIMANYAMKSHGELINHINAIRIRVVGIGDLKMQLQSLDDIVTQDLQNLTMDISTNIEPTKLANFKEQRARLQGKTTEFGEYFRITRIIIFAKPVATDYPS